MYYNYHKHDHYGNPWTMDVVVKPEEYCKRAVELGHNTVFTVNHGVTGNVFEWIDKAKAYGLKWCYGTEAYFVKDRFAKDKSNKHLIVIAKNNDGFYQLNEIMSLAHTTGFYYKPRIDQELLFSLDPKNFIITTACVAGIWEDTELILALHRKFGDNFFLEMQDHNMEAQKVVNCTLYDLAQQAKIPMIHANDSHYIYPDDQKYCSIFRRGKSINYAEEDGMVLDYPDEETIYDRYSKQGIFNHSQVAELLNNTLVFETCEPITVINDDIKLPPISENPTEDLRQILRKQWLKERKLIPREKWKTYTDAIQYELDIVEQTHMENYFLIDYYVAQRGQKEYGGRLTNTGRGSAPSFYITKLLGLTDIDRISAPITLYPTRFMSVARSKDAKSLPDIDLNTTDRVPFIKATEDLLGKENCAWMLAWKPLKASSALRVYCKGIGMNISEYDDVAQHPENYKDDPKWKDIIAESERFVGVTESVAESPCSMLLYDKPVNRELGLVRTANGSACCLLDGYNCDKYKYLKNDYLTVTVWAIIKAVCESAGIPIPTIAEIDKLLDDQTYDIYRNKLTCTINQADSDNATGHVGIYCPHSVSEMSAFVAIIRPGCASFLNDFIHRRPYSTNIPELDALLEDGNHRMIYQELIMKYLIWLGIPEPGSYDIIKKIAKKKFKEDELSELKDRLLKGWIERVGTEQGFIETWTVVEQAASYSFNACLSGDTVIQRAGAAGHWQPSISEMYRIKNDKDYAMKTNHLNLHQKYKYSGYGNALSMFPDDRIKKNRIVDIYDSGIAKIYRVTTKNGSYIDCTMNHSFPTPNGKKTLSDLCVGDLLYVKAVYEVNRNKYNLTNGSFIKNTPVKGQRGFQNIPNGQSVLFESTRQECISKNMACESCGRQFDDAERFELHHVNGDRANNNRNNLAWLCCSCHKKSHYKTGRIKVYEKGIPTELSEIVRIEYLRTDHVYDVEMADPAHTIISQSGLVASNSHSLSYAYDSLYGAYLKAHYPLDYYTVTLNTYFGDAPRTAKLVAELPYFHIELKPIKFRYSRSQYSFVREKNLIYKGITSIKEMNSEVAEQLYDLRDHQYANFVDCLYDITQNTAIKKNQLALLIRLDFFEEFGDPKQLLQMYKWFLRLKDRKELRQADFDKLPWNMDDLRPYAGTQTAKTLKKIDFHRFMSDYFPRLPWTPATSLERGEAQARYLGYVDVVDASQNDIAIVLDVDTKYSPRLKLYSLRRGIINDCKMNKKKYQKISETQKLERGDVIRLLKWSRKPKVHWNGNDWVPNTPTEMELWIDSIERINNVWGDEEE